MFSRRCALCCGQDIVSATSGNAGGRTSKSCPSGEGRREEAGASGVYCMYSYEKPVGVARKTCGQRNVRRPLQSPWSTTKKISQYQPDLTLPSTALRSSGSGMHDAAAAAAARAQRRYGRTTPPTSRDRRGDLGRGRGRGTEGGKAARSPAGRSADTGESVGLGRGWKCGSADKMGDERDGYDWMVVSGMVNSCAGEPVTEPRTRFRTSKTGRSVSRSKVHPMPRGWVELIHAANKAHAAIRYRASPRLPPSCASSRQPWTARHLAENRTDWTHQAPERRSCLNLSEGADVFGWWADQKMERTQELGEVKGEESAGGLIVYSVSSSSSNVKIDWAPGEITSQSAKFGRADALIRCGPAEKTIFALALGFPSYYRHDDDREIQGPGLDTTLDARLAAGLIGVQSDRRRMVMSAREACAYQDPALSAVRETPPCLL
nr:hypothetical protein CFP56_53371 [Quercus suber]